MQQQRVRRIQVSNSLMDDSKWDEGWLGPALARLNKHPSRLVRCSGLAGIIGGVLWLVHLFFLQVQILGLGYFYADYPGVIQDCADCSNPYHVGIHGYLIAVPILFFLVSLSGLYLYALYRLYLSWLSTLGGLLSLVGITMVIANTLGKYWLWWLGGYGGLFDRYGPQLTLIWYGSLGPGFVIFSLGLMVFVISNIRGGVLAIGRTLLLVVTSVAINIFALAQRLGLLPGGYEIDVGEYQSIIFMILLVLFGIGWIRLGAALWKRSSNVLSHPEAT